MTMTSGTWTRDGTRPGDHPHATVHPLLLEEKLTVPEPAGPIVPRTRLYDLLATATRRRITTLVAPAGSGKTTLLSSWLRETGPARPATWVTLDHFDNDPDVFHACLGAGLGRIATGTGHGAVGRSNGRTGDRQRGLVEALFDIGEPSLLVLDNIEEIDNPLVLRGIDDLLRRGPASV